MGNTLANTVTNQFEGIGGVIAQEDDWKTTPLHLTTKDGRGVTKIHSFMLLPEKNIKKPLL